MRIQTRIKIKMEKGKPIKLKPIEKFSIVVTKGAGSSVAFVISFTSVLIWAISGPFFHYSDNWQLVINTGTTIVTFLMVFLIQNAQNRESKAIHLKLDEIIRALENARNEMIDIENATEEHLDVLAERYSRLANSRQEEVRRN